MGGSECNLRIIFRSHWIPGSQEIKSTLHEEDVQKSACKCVTRPYNCKHTHTHTHELGAHMIQMLLKRKVLLWSKKKNDTCYLIISYPLSISVIIHSCKTTRPAIQKGWNMIGENRSRVVWNTTMKKSCIQYTLEYTDVWADVWSQKSSSAMPDPISTVAYCSL